MASQRCCLLVFFLGVLLVDVGAIDISAEPPTGTVACTETGFSPTITQAFVADTNISVVVKVGSGSTVNAGCQSADISIRNGTDSVTVTDLNGGNAIEFRNGTNISCGGTVANSVNGSNIEYSVTVELIQTQTVRARIIRKKKYLFAVKCKITRQVDSVTSEQNLTVDASTFDPISTTDVETEFTLDTTLKFYGAGWSGELSSTFEVKHGSTLYFRVEETNDSPVFMFAVNECWSTPEANAQSATKDVFFTDMCPVDDTATFTEGGQDNHQFSVSLQAFAFVSAPSASIYVHCAIYICKTGSVETDCVQNDLAACGIDKRRRKRRGVGSSEDMIEERIISSRQTFVFDNVGLYAPYCHEGFVFDRKKKECTDEQTMIVKGIYLDMEWKPLYANTSSHAFGQLAREKAFLLYALIQVTGTDRYIHGIKVLRAYHGSVVLDVLVKYADSSNAESAFKEFERATTSTTTTRVMNMLKLKQGETIEFVPVLTQKATDMRKMTLVVIVVILSFVIFILGIAFYKVMHSRRRPTIRSQNNNGFDKNSDFDKKTVPYMYRT